MRRPFILSCVALIALAALDLWMWRKFTRERESATELRTALSDVQQTPALSIRADHAVVERVETSLPLAATAPTAAVQAAPAEKADPVRAWQERERQMLRDPQYRDAQRDAARRQFAQTYADAIRVVRMSPSQADRVIDLWIERNMWFTEHADLSGNGQMSDEARAEMQRRSDTEQAEVRDLLGPEKYASWQHYLQTGSERAEINLFNSQLAADSAPLTSELVDTLVESFYREMDRGQRDYREYRKSLGATDAYENPSRDDRQRYLDLMRAANDRIHDAMAGSLNAVQLRKLDAMLAAKLVPIEAQLRLDMTAGRP